MTSNEYNKEALRILQELKDTDISKIAPESSPVDIADIFIIQLLWILAIYVDKKPTSIEVMKEVKYILGDIKVNEFNEVYFANKSLFYEQENLDFEELYTTSIESLDKIEKYFAPLKDVSFIYYLKYGMMHLPDIERFLHQVKVKLPAELITRIVGLENFDQETLQNEKILWEKKYGFGGEKMKFLFFLSFYYFYRNLILGTVFSFSVEEIRRFSNVAKFLASKYESTFKERIEQYRLYFNNIDEFYNTHAIPFFSLNKIIIERIMKNTNEEYSSIFSFLESELSKIGYSKFYIDWHWFIYYFCYCHTPDFIDFFFSLLDSELPLRFQEAFLQTAKKSVVAPIVQYEYEWYCRKHNQDPQFQFYEGDPIDWKKSNIVNYDLDKWVSPLFKNKTLPRNESNKDFISTPIENSNELIPLPLPFIFEGLRPKEQLVALRKLHELTHNYQESNENDFCYLLGRTPENYDKTKCEKIDWKRGKPELQYFIIKLCKKDKTPRCTWNKSDNIFRIDGIKELKLKENTTTNIENLSDETKNHIDTIIEDTLKYIKEKHT